jgi:hypothetical protein
LQRLFPAAGDVHDKPAFLKPTPQEPHGVFIILNQKDFHDSSEHGFETMSLQGNPPI